MPNYPFYEIALNLVEGVGAVTARQLISYCGSAEAIFRAPKRSLLKIPQVGKQIVENLFQSRILYEAEKEIKQAEKHQAKILSFLEPEYPQRLKNLPDAPIILYCQGEVNLNPPKSIAIVGTREASEYGRSFTEDLVSQLAKFQPLVVSGLAYGIDISAHRACVRHQVATLGVMASGLDIIYPSGHRACVHQMLGLAGGIVTENRWGTKPDAARFPARNRIIAGMVDAVLVIEAKSKGGALITADIANSYHKDVLAVPGSIHAKTSEGCHKLIKEHKAHLMTDIADLAYILHWEETEHPQYLQGNLDFKGSNLTAEEEKIVNLVKASPEQEMLLDEISWKLQSSIAQVSAHLLNLEMMGIIKALPGKKFTINAVSRNRRHA